ncbi:hypothetical protein AAA799E16_01398 [Marine Group I thaumarchaeote SCGC AAA799-E16]|uniref:Uncharacterized protein n=2 Tax=Marine Group I TaxID=905826 RepID=A0A087RXV4_9ARCH|nr:hypothetical protein AAA799E16_01398 [Marine Group I thaumarchaeote SCGC AAA799-E16]KFM18308.1 hypothetical protein SCCGRSA3_01227 [Marine Group I thaumarchaeote SCGC RSA3]
MSDVLEFLEKSSTGKNDVFDSVYLRSMSGNLPKNSGVQTVYPSILNTQFLAKNMHWKFVPYALEMAKNNEYGVFSISSENGNGIKSINTQRYEQHMTGKNTSDQKVSDWDKFVYGSDRFDNNEQ